MHFSSLLAATAVASVALAAPATGPAPYPLQAREAEGTFKVPRVLVKGQKLSGPAAMKKAFAKFNMAYTEPVSTVVKPAHLSRRQVSKINKKLSNLALDPETQSTVASLMAEILADVQAESAASCASANAPAAASTGTSNSAAGAGSAGSASLTGGAQAGGATATPEQGGALYLTPVNIGGQTVHLDFDTGSSDLWVFDKTSTGRGFDTTTAQGFSLMKGSTFMISYGDGSTASGQVGTDTVKVGSATVTGQAVELATTVSQSFQSQQGTDGLLGLAFSSLNTVKPVQQKTFYANIMPQLSTPVFTANLLLDGSGTYEFGKIDSTKYTGEIQYTAVNSSSGFWQFPSTTYKVGGTAGTNTAPNPAIADTGTSLMLVDDNVATAYYAKVPGATNDATQGGWIYSCDTKLPDFSVALGDAGDQYVTVPGAAVTYMAGTGGQCFGGIQSNQGNPIQIYGDILLKTQYVVFDASKPQIGFAPSAGASNTTQPAVPSAAAAARR